MSVTENIDRIEQGKTSIISSIKSKGVNVPNGVLINEIAPYINEIQSGSGGSTEEDIVPGGPHNPENDAFEEDFLWIENVDDKDGTITLKLSEAPFIYYSYDDDTEFQKMVSTNKLSIPAHSKIYLRWKGKITCSSSSGFISNTSSNCNHKIGGELKNGGLKSNVYEYLFCNNTKLIDASQLKLTATALASNCYSYMFQGCTSLTTAPELPATILATYCYQYMFQGCTSLTTAPAILPATKLASNCYSNMFKGCTSLTTAPAILPATKLASNCYVSMFNGCTSLTTAPELPATTLTSSCYSGMFSGCTSLNYVKINVINWSTSYASNWLSNVAPNGVVEVLPISTITENSASGVPSGWTKRINTSTKNTINIHNISGLENTISIPNKYSTFKYKTNNDTEYKENPKTTTLTITLKSDEILIIEGIYYPSTSSSSFTGITSTENINVSGEVNYSTPYMLFSLFNSSKKLIDASELQLTATTLESYCYSYMFYGCTNLTTAPELPATTLADNCYFSMFYNCSNLTTAPELPATTLADNCYYQMFYSCTNLTTATELPATTLANSCCRGMFFYCSNLTTAPELPSTKLAGYCYYQMFQGCTSLTTAPALPATTLEDSCYNNMFSGCSKLNSLTFLSTEPFIYNDNDAKTNWLSSVSSTGTFRTPIENKEWLDTYPRSASAVPSGWTIEYIEPTVPIEPELPEVADNEDILVIENVDEVEGTVLLNNPNNIAIQYSTNGSQFNDYTTATEVSIKPSEKVYFKWSDVINNSSNSTALVSSSVKYNVYGELKKGNNEYAYRYMFRKESNLIDASQLKLTATTLANNCYEKMFNGCTSLTTAPELPATVLAESCYKGMFDSCSSLTTAPALPATTLASNCYYGMFYFCSNLTTAPELPATVLAESCYSYMFAFCYKLNYVKHHITEWNTSNTTSWINEPATGTVECPANSTIPSNSDSGIPSGWTRVDF